MRFAQECETLFPPLKVFLVRVPSLGVIFVLMEKIS